MGRPYDWHDRILPAGSDPDAVLLTLPNGLISDDKLSFMSPAPPDMILATHPTANNTVPSMRLRSDFSLLAAGPELSVQSNLLGVLYGDSGFTVIGNGIVALGNSSTSVGGMELRSYAGGGPAQLFFYNDNFYTAFTSVVTGNKVFILPDYSGTAALTLSPFDLTITDTTKGLVLTSPDLTTARMTLADTDELIGVTAIATSIKTTTGPTVLVNGAIADGEFLRRVGATVVGAAVSTTQTIRFTGTFDGGGSTPTTGTKCQCRANVACTITKATIIGDSDGSAVVDVNKSTYAGFPTTASIAAAALPTLAAAQKNEDSTLTGWTTAVAAGDIIEFELDSVTTCTSITVQIDATIT